MKGLIQYVVLAVVLVLAPSCSDVAFNSKGGEGEVTTTCVGASCVPVTFTYAWYESGYVGSCSKPCGGGEETQVVECRRSDNVVVADTFCPGARPVSVRGCNLNACTNTYSWNAGNWSANCDKTCGGGVRTRTVVCQNQSGTTVADTNCTDPKPATTIACNTHACPPTYTYGWQVTAGTCTKSCGGGTQTDIVECKRNDGSIVADSFCSATPKPPVTYACNTQVCPVTYTYQWFTGNPWSTCSKTCGGGTQTRSVPCRRDQDGVFVADNLCTGAKPATSQACNSQACATTRAVTQSEYVTPAKNQVDVIMIMDDSSSMGPDNAKLGQRMAGFLGDLDALNIDYQVCITTTDVRPPTAGFAGSPLKWTGLGTYVITKSTPNKQKIFTDTVTTIGSGYSSDEQGIKAMGLMIRDFRNSGCFRAQAAMATILISDEDERSVGGNCALSSQQCQTLEAMNYPDTLINQVHSAFDTTGFVKPFIYNSIIVKPGDSACEATQDAQSSPSFPGVKYNELSGKTGGYVGSICATDYSQNLSYIKNVVVNSLPGVTLECVPVGAPVVTYSAAVTTTVTLQGQVLKFSPSVPQGTTVTIKYNCPL